MSAKMFYLDYPIYVPCYVHDAQFIYKSDYTFTVYYCRLLSIKGSLTYQKSLQKWIFNGNGNEDYCIGLDTCLAHSVKVKHSFIQKHLATKILNAKGKYK